MSQRFALEFTSNETKRKQRISGVTKFQKAPVDLSGDNVYWATETRGNVPRLADFWLNVRCSFCPPKWKTRERTGCWKTQVKVGSQILPGLEPHKCYCSDTPTLLPLCSDPTPANLSVSRQAELTQGGLRVSSLCQCVYNTVLPIPRIENKH